MEKKNTEELAVKSMASNSKPSQSKTSDSREEGEVSSSDNDTQAHDVHPVCSAVPGSVASPISSILPKNKCSAGIHAASADVCTRTSIQTTSQKICDNDQVVRKASTPWGASREANSNLVISFSDDSGSDLDECSKEKTSKSYSNAVRHFKTPTSLLDKSNKLRSMTRNKVVANKLSSSQSFITSMTKTLREDSKGAAGPSFAEQGSRIRPSSGNILSQGRGNDQGMNLNSSKLQDLREQIAIWESKLKLKSAQQNKEIISVTNQDYIVTNSKSDLGRNENAAISQFPPPGPKGPDAKRIKTNGSYSTKPSLSGQQHLHAKNAVKSVSRPQEPGGETQNIKVTYNQKRNSMSREESGMLKQQSKEDFKHVSASPSPGSDIGKVQDGTGIVANGNQSDWISKQVDPHPLVIDQAAVLPNSTSNVQTKFDNIEFQSRSDGLQLPASTEKKYEGTRPQSASNAKIFELFSNFFKSSINGKTTGTAFGNSSSCLDFSNFDLQSLFEMEESLDKDLEEAQDCRRRCEIEERNAFKIYSRAQRDLIESNSRCLDLYHKRELFSAQFHSFFMNNPGLVSSSRQQEDMKIGVDHSNSMSGNSNRASPLYQKHSEYNSFTQLQNDLNMQHENASPINTLNLHENRLNLGSEPGSCSDLCGNTLDPVPSKGKNIADRICSTSIDRNVLVDGDEELFPSDHEMMDSYDECYMGKKRFEDDQKEACNLSKKNHYDNNTEDSLRLEAKLRSELFARLGTRNLSKTCDPCHNIQTSVEQGAENDATDDRTQQNSAEPTVGQAVENDVDLRSEKTENALLSGKRDRQFGFGGPDRCKTPDDIPNWCHFENVPLETHDSADSDDIEPSNREGPCSKTSFSFTPLTLNSVLQHRKAISSVSIEILVTRTRGSHSNLGFPEEGVPLKVDPIHRRKIKENSVHETVRRMFQSDGSYIDDLAIDSSWPLCMYELRGKCNNDECPWQHMKDYSFANKKLCQHGHSNYSDSCNGLSFSLDDTKVFKYEDLMTPPTYLVGVDILKADSHSYDSVLVRKSSQCWQNVFSISLTLPNLLQKDASADGLFLHDARIEAKGCWNRQSSYFQSGSTSSKLSQLKQADVNQALETALIIINQETNNREGMKKALSVLSRAVENNPKSLALWTIYLLIFYSYTTTGGKDDMFSYAVKHNGQSYELWLMYINSRMNLDARLAAYDAALSALCNNIFTHNLDGKYASAHILDLILQMTNCLCMSGNVEKAIQRIFGLLRVAMDSDEPCSFTHSDMLTCLNISDKCIFWVCVVYLVIYRKLPHAVVQQLECEKELLEIEWPTIQLTDGEKQRASSMVKNAVDFVDSCLNSESLESKSFQKSVQMFAVNHIRCLMAFEDIGFSRNLLDKYVKLYPSCLELLLLKVRAKKSDFGDETVVAFEEAIMNWPNEVPGVQCIWNQYAEYLLQNGRTEYTEELMLRWFNSTSKMNCCETRILDNSDCNSLHLLDYASGSIVHALDCSLNEVDVVFWYLNLSVHKLLQNDQLEARLAFDNALKAANSGTFKYCMREYAMFLLTDESLLNEAASIGGIRSILEGYLNDVRAFPVPEPLSRKFINDIKKPRVQLLISNMLSPISPDVSLVNCILEVWYGPSLLPQKFSKPKELVDFVETILEMLPSNYQLVLCVCKQLCNGNDSSQVTSASLIFWACSNLIGALFCAVPIPPEFIWVESANILVNVKGFEAITERFHTRALSVYPFSVQLWTSYYNMCKTRGSTSAILQAVNERGIKLNEASL